VHAKRRKDPARENVAQRGILNARDQQPEQIG
jgi:hypothetical protein